MSTATLPQIIAVGAYNAQLAVKNAEITHNRKTTMFELELAIDKGGISYIDKESRPITEDLVICAKPGQMRHTKLPYKCLYIHMIVSQGQLYRTLTALPNYIKPKNTAQIKEIFAALAEHADTGVPEDELLLQSLLFRLIYLLHKEADPFHTGYRPKSNNHAAIERTLAYINDHLTDDLTLDMLAEEAKFSPIYFHKLFKASTGKTLHEYILQKRIQRAINLLLSTDMTLSQIACECGFSSQSYFSDAFKRHTGLSPRAYAMQAIQSYYNT